MLKSAAAASSRNGTRMNSTIAVAVSQNAFVQTNVVAVICCKKYLNSLEIGKEISCNFIDFISHCCYIPT